MVRISLASERLGANDAVLVQLSADSGLLDLQRQAKGLSTSVPALNLVLGGSGANTVDLSQYTASFQGAGLLGDLGDDVLAGGSSGDILVGGEGRDTLTSPQGANSLLISDGVNTARAAVFERDTVRLDWGKSTRSAMDLVFGFDVLGSSASSDAQSTNDVLALPSARIAANTATSTNASGIVVATSPVIDQSWTRTLLDGSTAQVVANIRSHSISNGMVRVFEDAQGTIGSTWDLASLTQYLHGVIAPGETVAIIGTRSTFVFQHSGSSDFNDHLVVELRGTLAISRLSNTPGAGQLQIVEGFTPRIASFDDDAGSFIGSVTVSGASTDDNTPTFRGTLTAPVSAGQSLRVFDGNSDLGAAAVTTTGSGSDSSTSWSFTPSVLLSDGAHVFAARIESATGLRGPASNSFNVVIDTAAPTVTPTITNYSDDAAPQTGSFDTNSTTNDTQPTLSGTLSAPLSSGQTLRIFDGTADVGKALVKTTLTASGSITTWSFTPTAPLSTGSHDITARASSATGLLGPISNSFNITIETQAPTTLGTISSYLDDVAPQTGSFVGNTSTNDPQPTLNGTLSAPLTSGQSLRVFDGATDIGAAVVTTTGSGSSTWSFTPTDAIAEGAHLFTTRVRSASGLEGPASNAFSLTVANVDTTPPKLLSATAQGGEITLSFDEALDATRFPDLSSFRVVVSPSGSQLGERGLSISNMRYSSDGKSIVLTLVRELNSSDEVRISYRDPSSGNDSRALQDVTGNDAASWIAQPVTVADASNPGSARIRWGRLTEPTATASIADPGGSVIELVFDHRLQLTQTNAAGGPASVPFKVSKLGATVFLALFRWPRLSYTVMPQQQLRLGTPRWYGSR